MRHHVLRQVLGVAGAALLLLASPLRAADLAFIIANGNYRSLPDVSRGDDAIEAATVFEDLGFRVVAQEDAGSAALATAVASFVRQAPEADRVLVVLSGRFLHSDQESWLLPVDMTDPGLDSLPRSALPLSTVLSVLAGHPGQAVLLLGQDGLDRTDSPFLDGGIGSLDVPQGVTVFAGTPRRVADFAAGALARPGSALTVAASRAGLQGSGYLAPQMVFVARSEAPRQIDEGTTEAAFWEATRERDTIASYQSYLDRFPDGPHADEARNLIAEIRAEPGRAARLAEEALALSRNERREIQRDLSLLGYDTRGIDGIFGPGTRRAISRWQTENGHEITGYLTRDLIAQLDAQAERRAAELEAEAEARRAEQEQKDRAYWAETGAAGDEAGLRAYLKRYPDGVFAELAHERLAVIEANKRQGAAAKDRAAWDFARRIDTPEAYRDYLAAYPDGAFAPDASARLAELTDQDKMSAELAAAKRTEDRLGLDIGTKRAMEQRLARMGFKPGKVDGVFDKNTRRAIRRYQASRNIRATGYLNQQTVVLLLADSIFR